MNSGVAVVIPARNEENFLGHTIKSLLDQTIQPEKVIVVNDGSTDRTRDVGLQYGAEVIDLKDRGYNVQGYPILADVINHGLVRIKHYRVNNQENDIKYIMILGSDHLLPRNYVDTILNEMSKDRLLAICSGQIRGERSVVPRGSGRIVNADFWNEIGLCYPANYGFETYLLIKAQQMGYKIKALNNLVTETQRKTGHNYKKSSYVSYGKSLKALGYSRLYSIARICLLSKRNPKVAYYMLKGYTSNDIERYDVELRSYLSSIQHQRIKRYLVNPIRSLRYSNTTADTDAA